jgi:hypothetical protein
MDMAIEIMILTLLTTFADLLLSSEQLRPEINTLIFLLYLSGTKIIYTQSTLMVRESYACLFIIYCTTDNHISMMIAQEMQKKRDVS